jgi:predicted dehydrogenase
MTLGVGIIGAGLIGNKRASALQKVNGCHLVMTADVNTSAAKRLAANYGGEAESDWRRIIYRKGVDVVVVATFNKFLKPVSVAALKNKKHVLCEKPLGRNADESRAIIETAHDNGVVVKTGFNHRHHPAISKAKQLIKEGILGRVTFLRAKYGHGGRPGYDKEWRAKRDLSGGGELLDQGVHVVDLFRFFAGDFTEAFGYTERCFWDMEVEDNAFGMFKNDDGIVATMHTSWTQWKNLFSFEIFCTDGFVTIDGLGGSYGTETLRIGKRNAKGGAPVEKVIEFFGPDVSWEHEWKELVSAIENGNEPMGNGWDGYQANRMIEALYKSAKTGRPVSL